MALKGGDTVRTNYQRGYEVEARARKELLSAGYYVMRSSGSKGVFDLIAVGNGEVLLLQMKRSKRKLGPGSYKEDFAKMQDCVAGLVLPDFVRAQLWLWIDFKGWSKFDLSDVA